MSYCRFTEDSDVYVIRGTDGLICFCDEGTIQGGKGQFSCKTEQAMLDHLHAHRERGDKVPNDAIGRLLKEKREKKSESLNKR